MGSRIGRLQVCSSEYVSALQVTSAVDDVLARLPSDADVAVVRDGTSTVIAAHPEAVVRANGNDAFEALDRIDAGWWAGFLSYDLGRAVERVPVLNPPEPGLPDLVLARFAARAIVDAEGNLNFEGPSTGRTALERALTGPPRTHRSAVGSWRSSFDWSHWNAAVARILQHLHDGDCYQVNLTRRLDSDTRAHPNALFRALVHHNPAPHEALVRIGDVAVVSASPERFLRVDGRRVETRPIKGTASSAEALVRSSKDRAENVMIVDLARNDLGRVCEYGTVHVPALFALEAHPGMYHLVSTVAGTLRADATFGDVLRATFPPASVTGCPKPRVLEIIESLEPVRRGVYCGAIGFLHADERVLDLNVAIRTFTVTTDRTSFGVGGGIVADSDPGAEWEETELKSRRLLAVAAGEPS